MNRIDFLKRLAMSLGALFVAPRVLGEVLENVREDVDKKHCGDIKEMSIEELKDFYDSNPLITGSTYTYKMFEDSDWTPSKMKDVWSQPGVMFYKENNNA